MGRANSNRRRRMRRKEAPVAEEEAKEEDSTVKEEPVAEEDSSVSNVTTECYEQNLPDDMVINIFSKEPVAEEDSSVSNVTTECYERNLPDDMVINILSKLSLEHLLRFRCVSKEWHRCISQCITTVQKVVLPSDDDTKDWFLSIDQTTQVEELDIVVVRKRDRSSSCWFDKPYICGSCDGLLLVAYKHDFFLWNSTTRSRRLLKFLGNLRSLRYYKTMGLCFDENNHDYKVVVPSGDKVLVGSMKAKNWKQLDNIGCLQELNSPGVVLHNNLHWWAHDGEVSHDKIVCFDPKVDEFRYLAMPQSCIGEIRVGFGALDGCLCMCRWEKPYTLYIGQAIDVLVMKEYGVEESWTIFFKFIRNSGIIHSLVPLFYTDENRRRILMHVGRNYNSAIVNYDIDSSLCEDIKVLTSDKEPLNAIVYEETFVSN